MHVCCVRLLHHAAKQYFGLIAPAGHGARRACVNRAAPSSCQWAPRRPGGAATARLGVPSRPSPAWHRTSNDLVPLTHGGSGLAIFERDGQGLEQPGAAVQSLPNYCRLKRQNAVRLAAVRNGVIVAKHAFYRSHSAFRTSFEVLKPHYLLF
jgi:hypothetical protein